MLHSYKLNGYNIILDISSGSIHSVDAVAYDAINLYGRGGREAAEKYTRKTYPDITAAQVDELFSDIEELIQRGKLLTPDVFSDIIEPAKKRTLKALCLNVSHLCNMRCTYCFAGRGEYGGDEGLMSLETGVQALDFLIANSGGRKNLDVDFFGGEPLLNWGVVKDIISYAREIESASGKKFRFTLTTNGLLIDDDVIDFTNREISNVVLSLDGRPEINDNSRKLLGGGGSYSDVVPKFKKFTESRGENEYYIRGTFTRDNLDFTSDILHIADLGFTELSMEPAVAEESAPYGLSMDDLPTLFEQYEKLAKEMLTREEAGRAFTFYHYKLDLSGGPCVYKRVLGCGVGAEYMAVTPRGDLYPCHQFVGNSSFLLGNVASGITNERLHDVFCGRNVYNRPECRECWARLYCSGGCAANSFNAAGSIDGIYKLGCELFKKRMECAIMIKVARSVNH